MRYEKLLVRSYEVRIGQETERRCDHGGVDHLVVDADDLPAIHW
jgi:hypothetical protein